MKLILAIICVATLVCAQNRLATDPVIGTSQAFFAGVKDNVMKSAEKIPEDLWSFRPTPQVRTIGQLFAHIADGQYEFCGMATGNPPQKNIEQTATKKAEITAALKAAFAYCDGVYAHMTAASAVETVQANGQRQTRIGLMDFNIAHTDEHYGNLVTYMRIKGIVPPSSAQ
jgi:uncharacterized damage-inducible protein DinB